MTRRRTIGRFHLLAIFAALVFFASAFPSRAEAESIKNFDAEITLRQDGVVLVSEKIVYDFGDSRRHGIFRDIPLAAANGPRLTLRPLRVADEFGKAYRYDESVSGGALHLKIGDPDELVNGIKTYVIEYQVYGAIRTFPDHDELYWNITGNGWQVPIENATSSVRLPDPFPESVRMDCFTGGFGSTEKNCVFQSASGSVRYTATRSLSAGEGMTLVLGMPPGSIRNIAPAPPEDRVASLKFWFGIAFFGVLFFLVAVIRFVRRGSTPVLPKELRGRPVTVEYRPPENLSPIEAGTILNRRVDVADLASVILDLAVRGYVKIRYTIEELKFRPDKKDFEFIKLKDGADLGHPAERGMFDLLFGSRGSVRLSELQKEKAVFHEKTEIIKEETMRHLSEEGYFDATVKNKLKKFGVYAMGGLAAALAGVFFFQSGAVFAVVAVAGIVLGFNAMVPDLTSLGRTALMTILGFKEFLQLVEKEKLALLNAPELKPETFEKFLPYAMVLGVEEKWAQKFEGIYETSPNWYEDSSTPVFTSAVLVNNLHTFGRSFHQVYAASSKNSSGFSGGSSGGGSGGGGGGSW